jgi:uncharacterized protein YcfL
MKKIVLVLVVLMFCVGCSTTFEIKLRKTNSIEAEYHQPAQTTQQK